MYSNLGIPKLYIEAGRKRHPVTHKLPNADLFNGQKSTSGDTYIPPPEVVEFIQDLDGNIDDEVLNDEQREVMEDIWLKAEEMGM